MRRSLIIALSVPAVVAVAAAVTVPNVVSTKLEQSLTAKVEGKFPDAERVNVDVSAGTIFGILGGKLDAVSATVGGVAAGGVNADVHVNADEVTFDLGGVLGGDLSSVTADTQLRAVVSAETVTAVISEQLPDSWQAQRDGDAVTLTTTVLPGTENVPDGIDPAELEVTVGVDATIVATSTDIRLTVDAVTVTPPFDDTAEFAAGIAADRDFSDVPESRRDAARGRFTEKLTVEIDAIVANLDDEAKRHAAELTIEPVLLPQLPAGTTVDDVTFGEAGELVLTGTVALF